MSQGRLSKNLKSLIIGRVTALQNRAHFLLLCASVPVLGEAACPVVLRRVSVSAQLVPLLMTPSCGRGPVPRLTAAHKTLAKHTAAPRLSPDRAQPRAADDAGDADEFFATRCASHRSRKTASEWRRYRLGRAPSVSVTG